MSHSKSYKGIQAYVDAKYEYEGAITTLRNGGFKGIAVRELGAVIGVRVDITNENEIQKIVKMLPGHQITVDGLKVFIS